MTMYKVLHPRDDVDRLHVSRKEGGKWLTNIDDSVDESIKRFRDYIKSAEEDNTRTNRTEITRKERSEEKQVCGHFKRQTSNFQHKKTWTWPRKGNVKSETESLLIAAQNNSIWTNYIKTRIDKT